MYIISSEGIAYHQHEVLYIIKPQENTRRRVMRYKGGKPPLMIYTALRAVMICQACGLDKQKEQTDWSALFVGRGTRDRTQDTRFWRPLLYLLSYTPIYLPPLLRRLWWTIRDSNPGPTGYEPVALTN